jgi:hypothetical protein
MSDLQKLAGNNSVPRNSRQPSKLQNIRDIMSSTKSATKDARYIVDNKDKIESALDRVDKVLLVQVL